MAVKDANRWHRPTLRSPPLVDMKDMYPWAGDRTDVEKSFNENNLEPLGGLPTKDKRPPRRRQTAQADGGMASDAGNRARDASVFERLKGMFTNPESYAGYVGMKAVPDLPGRGVPVNINLGSTNPGPAPMNDADFLQGGATIPSGQYRGPQSNAQMKFDQGNPVPFSGDWVSQAWNGMWNAFDQMLRGTVFGAQPGQTTTVPKMPPSVPMPEPNPMFHQMSMVDPAQAAVDQMMAMPHWPQPAAPPSFFGGGETPSVPDINPPIPEKKAAPAKPQKVEAKENTEAKRKSSPPTPTRNPRRA